MAARSNSTVELDLAATNLTEREQICAMWHSQFWPLDQLGSQAKQGDSQTYLGQGYLHHGQLGMALAFLPLLFSVQSYGLYAI
jgi:hypothetical protein